MFLQIALEKVTASARQGERKPPYKDPICFHLDMKPEKPVGFLFPQMLVELSSSPSHADTRNGGYW